MNAQRETAPASAEAGMTRIVIRLGEHPSPIELERARMQIFSRLAESNKGLLIDCREIGKTSAAALAMMQTAKNYALSDGKRLTLYKPTTELISLLRAHDSIFQLDVYGFQPSPTKIAPSNRGWIGRLSPAKRRILRNIILPIMIILPVVAAAEYFFVFNDDEEVVFITKTFESNLDDFIVEGIVEMLVNGKRSPNAAAIVMVWPDDPIRELGNRSWTTSTDSVGRFRLPLEIPTGTDFLEVRVAVLSQRSDGPALPSAVEAEPAVQISKHIMRAGTPLQVQAVSF